MKAFAIGLVFALLAGLAPAQDELYRSLPTYPRDVKIRHSSTGPKPGSKVGENAPRMATFVKRERHPPALQALVRTACGANVSQQELFDLAQRRKGPGARAKILDHGDVEGDRVQLYAVTVARDWKRTFKLKAKNGKYEVVGHRVQEKPVWRAVKLASTVNYATCHDQTKLTRQELWVMALAALEKIKGHNLSVSAGVNR